VDFNGLLVDQGVLAEKRGTWCCCLLGKVDTWAPCFDGALSRATKIVVLIHWKV
jgi:hypothetical protein